MTKTEAMELARQRLRVLGESAVSAERIVQDAAARFGEDGTPLSENGVPIQPTDALAPLDLLVRELTGRPMDGGSVFDRIRAEKRREVDAQRASMGDALERRLGMTGDGDALDRRVGGRR